MLIGRIAGRDIMFRYEDEIITELPGMVFLLSSLKKSSSEIGLT
jgi:hypothetical protein